MTEKEKTVLDKIREFLVAEGYEEQRSGQVYVNGEEATNFLSPKGELLHVSLDSMPDEEVVEDLFGEEQ